MPKDGFAAEQQEWLVKYSDDYRTLSEVRTFYEGTDIERITDQVDLFTFPDDTDMEAVKIDLERNPSIEYVEPNYERHLFSVVNDPDYIKQWWVPYVKADQAWTYAEPHHKKVVVAVIDSGIDLNHEDLKGRIEPGGYNFYSKNKNVADANGHGTMVSGVIAAESGNGKGITGIVGPYNVAVLPLKVSHSDGKSKVSDSIKAIDYAIEKKVAVINISLGGPSRSRAENDAIERAIDAGIVIVAAAGNDALKGNNINYPASYSDVISVGAIDQSGLRADFSNYNAHVDLVAPGKKIYTTSPFHSYKYVSGTSFSSPIVAGTVAMMKSVKPTLTKDEISTLLTETATDLGPVGRDDHYGAGLLNIKALAEQFEDEVNLKLTADFPEMTVNNSKVFTVTFNQNLDTSKDYTDEIIVSSNSDELQSMPSFKVFVDPVSRNKLLIAPTGTWSAGQYILTITKNVYNYDGKVLKKDVRMNFVVEDAGGEFGVAEISRAELDDFDRTKNR